MRVAVGAGGWRGSGQVKSALSLCSVAVEMWRVLTSHPKTAGKVLRELLNRLQERPLHPHHDVSQQEAGVAPLAVSSSPCSKGRSAVFPLHGLRVSLSLPLGIAIGPRERA